MKNTISMIMSLMFILEDLEKRKKLKKNPQILKIVVTMWGFGYKLGNVELK